MQNNFTFGHTIEPIQINSDSSPLSDLFKIGNQAISLSHSQIQRDSDSTPKQKKQKKVKKHHKKDRKRSRSPEHKKKKGKKEKKAAKEIIQIDSSAEDGVVAIYDNRKESVALQRLEKALKTKMTEEDLNKNFEVNKKVGDDLLSIDILSFPQSELYHYGPLDKDIPHYSKLINFQGIVGCKLKKYKDISLCIQRKINQKNSNIYTDDISKNRYFHFQGYEKLENKPLPDIRDNIPQQQSFLPFEQATIFLQSLEQMKQLKIQRQMNSKLNENPHDIDVWLQFVEVQNNRLLNSNLSKAAILERQITIIEKALQMNPLSPKLGLFYLDLMFRKHMEISFIMERCMEFIKAHPDCCQLWRFYIFLQLSQFHQYSHETIRTVFEELTQLLQSIIDSTRSAIQIWKIRKSGLEVIKTMVHIFKLEGYGEFATGIVVGLIDFNFFMPESVVKMTSFKEKIKSFQEYWQNHFAYKLGQIEGSGWELSYQDGAARFINCLSRNNLPNFTDDLAKELYYLEGAWRPSNPMHEKDIINQQPESYILFDDISSSLHLYRDTDSLTTLLDILADHLELPQIFHFTGIKNQFSYSLVKETYLNSSEKVSFGAEYNYWWKRYWNPFHTTFLFSTIKTQKLEYFRRILNSVLKKLPLSHRSSINRYLVFINCCYYASEEMRDRLMKSEEDTLKDLQDLLGQSSSDIGSWCIYIFTTYQMRLNTDECLDCFLQLLESSRNEKKNQEMQIFFWLWTFMKLATPIILKNILKLLLKLLDNPQTLSFSLQEDLNQNEERRLIRYLKEKLPLILDGPRPGKSEDIYLLLVIVSCVNSDFLLDLKSLSDKIAQFLVDELTGGSNQNQQHIIVNCLIDTQGLTIKDLQEKSLLSKMPFLEIVQLWVKQQVTALPLMLVQFQSSKQKSMTLWMIIFLFLQNDSQNRFIGLQDYFSSIGKKLCFEDSLDEQCPDYSILFCKLLMRGTEAQQQFLRFALKQLPFAKELYLYNLMSVNQQKERRQILTLMQEKNIRVFCPTIIEE